jgi:hypothetical protein
MNTLLQIQPLIQLAPDSPWTSIAKIVLAISLAVSIYFASKVFTGGMDKWKISMKMILINELQILIKDLPITAENFDRIVLEFSKLELTETQEDALWQIFMTRFEKIAKHRETINFYASTRLKTRLENRRKSIESELSDIVKDKEKTKSLFDRQQTNVKEQVLILLLNEYNDLLDQDKKKEPEKDNSQPAVPPAKAKREKKTVEALTLTL